MHIFLAGIMQGSHRGLELHDQGYRGRLVELLEAHLPAAKVYDPLAGHGESLEYHDDRARQVFYGHLEMCRDTDLLLAFVPEASMGTAMEMWEAWRSGRTVIAISPLTHNWAVKFCSHAVYGDIESLEHDLVTGVLAERIAQFANSVQGATAGSSSRAQ